MNTLQTERFTLRAITPDDAPSFARLCNDRLIARNTARIPHPYSLPDAQEFIRLILENRERKTEFAFAVCESDEIIACAGTILISEKNWEIGYWVGADARRRGVATEIGQAMINFSFGDLGAETVFAGYFFDNPASGQVLQKLGFRPTGDTVALYSRGRNAEVSSVRVAMEKSAWQRT